jgi:hypothetical protein
MIKSIIVRALGLLFATFFAGTGVGAIATDGDWFTGSIIGVGSAFAVVLTTIGVSMAWQGSADEKDIANAFRAAVAKAAEGNENLEAALKVEEDGDFTFDDVNWDSDDELFGDDPDDDKDGDDDGDATPATPAAPYSLN